MKNRRFIAILACIILVAGCLTACSGNDGTKNTDNTSQSNQENEKKNDTETTNKTDVTDNKVDSSKDNVQKTDSQPAATDVPAGNDNTEQTQPVLAAVSGSLGVIADVADGWSEKDGVYTITKGGEYTFAGEIENGQIYVDAPDEEVTIILNGVSMSSVKDSVIYINQAEETKIKAHAGTINTLSDLRARRIDKDEEVGSGCIYSKDDLKLQGQGTLIVSADYNNGIACKNDIKIKNLTLLVTAAGNGIKGNDSITVESGNISVTSTESDCLKTKNTDISSKGKQRGWISILGGTVTLRAADDCIKAAFDVEIAPEASVEQAKY